MISKLNRFSSRVKWLHTLKKRWGRDPLEQTRLDVYVGVKNVLKSNSQLNAHEISTKP